MSTPGVLKWTSLNRPANVTSGEVVPCRVPCRTQGPVSGGLGKVSNGGLYTVRPHVLDGAGIVGVLVQWGEISLRGQGLKGVSVQWGLMSGGIPVQWDQYIMTLWSHEPPPSVERQTHWLIALDLPYCNFVDGRKNQVMIHSVYFYWLYLFSVWELWNLPGFMYSEFPKLPFQFRELIH